MLSTPLVKCGKCKFSFHNNVNIEMCPRCGAKLNPNLVQGGIARRQRSKDEALMELTRVLAFGQSGQQNKGLVNVPLGISPIDRKFVQSKRPATTKRVQQGSNNNSNSKELRDLDRVLREFA